MFPVQEISLKGMLDVRVRNILDSATLKIEHALWTHGESTHVYLVGLYFYVRTYVLLIHLRFSDRNKDALEKTKKLR